MSNEKDRLQGALEEAAMRVAELPAELKAAAYQEAFRALYVPGSAAATPPMSASQQSAWDGTKEGSISLPDASDVKERGGRVVNVAFAIAKLSQGDVPCTSPAIKSLLDTELAMKIKGNGLTDVLRTGTPKYFSRAKGEGREYVYGLSAAGRKLLGDFAAGAENAQ